MNNKNLPLDKQQRLQALDPTQSFIVQAPAGSGKTTLLINRYLVLLAQAKRPEEILAITFTRKATAEMRDRIHEVLKDAAAEPTRIQDEIVRELALNVLEHDHKMQWNLRHNTARLKIMTIDSFCSELVRKMPITTGLGGIPNIEDNANKLYELAAERTIAHIEDNDTWSDACRQLLRIANGSWKKAEKLLSSMLASRDLWMQDIDLTNRSYVESIWQHIIQSKLDKAAQCIPQHLQQQIIHSLNYACSQLALEKHELKKPRLEWLELAKMESFPDCSVDELEKWQAIACFLTTENDVFWRKQYDINCGFKPKSKEKELVMALSKSLQEHASGQALHELADLPPAYLDEPTWQSMGALYNLLFLSAAELQVIVQQKNSCDFTEISQRADKALGELDSPSDLTLMLDYQIQHILMDEFQDTSVTQVRLLEKLIQGWGQDDVRTLFLVGDPMQSIYAFRGAEVGNFIHAHEKGLASITLNYLNLSSNFRCHANLIDWYNRVFKQIFPKQNNIINGAVCYTESSIGNHNVDTIEPTVQHHTLAKEANNDPSYIALLVQSLQAKHAEKTIAILGRTRTHLSAIASALDDLRIEHADTDIEFLADRPEIRDLLALTRALSHPADRIAWLAVLRAPWCAIELDALHTIANFDSNQCLYDSLNCPELITQLSTENKERIERVRLAIQQVNQTPWQSIAYRVERCWLQLDTPRLLNDMQLKNAKTFFSMLHQLAQNPSFTASDLEAQLALLKPAVKNTTSVQLMTIHKAKGLQFDIVILPYLDRIGSNSDKPIMKSLRMQEHVLLAPIGENPNALAHKYHKFLMDLDKKKSEYEFMRLLYVACTRAKSQLHLVAGFKTKDGELVAPDKRSLMHLLWATEDRNFFTLPSQKNEKIPPKAESALNPLLRACLPISQAKLPEPAIHTDLYPTPKHDDIEFSWAGEVARLVGIAVHEMLQHIDQIGWSRWLKTDDDSIEKKINCMNISANLDDQEQQQWKQWVITSIENIRKDTTAHWIFADSHQHKQSEWALTGVINNEIHNVIIDRSFVDENNYRWIIDFKTSRHEGSHLDEFLQHEKQRYQKQMDKYASIVAALDDRPIKLGLYFPLLKQWTCWDWDKT